MSHLIFRVKLDNFENFEIYAKIHILGKPYLNFSYPSSNHQQEWVS